MTQPLQPTRNELGEFLRARRAELGPAEVGLPAGPQTRRVPGLRREEVAQMAGISTDYYNRLEQGRLAPSRPALAAIGRSLRLDADQMAYLLGLVQSGARRSSRRTTQTIGPQTARLMELLPDAAVMIVGRYLDVLAWNPVAAALLTDFGALPIDQRNLLRMAFLDPEARARYVDWETVAREGVAYLRMDVARYPDDARLNALVGELSVQDADFRTWWASHQVAMATFGQKRFRHPQAGLLTLDWQMLGCAEDPEQTLYVISAPAGSPSAEALASWRGIRA